MILEHVIRPVRADRSAEFEEDFAEVRLLVQASGGFRGLSLKLSVEESSRQAPRFAAARVP